MVLESWYYTREVVQRYSRNLRHNSREFPTGCCWVPIPQKAAEEVLEAWYYTRRWSGSGPGGLVLDVGVRSGPGGLVLHQGGWDRSDPRGGNWIPGNSRLCSSVQIPQNMARLNQYQRLLGASIPMGSVIYTRVAWVTASDWNTGAQSSHGVINLHFVYTLSLFSLFILCHCLVCLYRHVYLLVYNKVTLVTPMPTRR